MCVIRRAQIQNGIRFCFLHVLCNKRLHLSTRSITTCKNTLNFTVFLNVSEVFFSLHSEEHLFSDASPLPKVGPGGFTIYTYYIYIYT